jgi:hypothetical protein
MGGVLRKAGLVLGGVVVAGGVAVPAGVLASSGAGALSPVTITSISFKGTAAKPTITVKGTGFGSTAPAADPSTHPNGQSNCPAFPSKPAKDIKKDGFDYGTDMLWLGDATGGWRGGDFVPGSETDCIGLIITKWSPTEIKFKPGTAYDNPTLENGFTWVLASGDSVTVDVLGTNGTTTY